MRTAADSPELRRHPTSGTKNAVYHPVNKEQNDRPATESAQIVGAVEGKLTPS
jgi:hypothetical protein